MRPAGSGAPDPSPAAASGLWAGVAALSARWRWPVLGLWIALAVLSIIAAALWLKVDTNPARMIDPHLKFRQDYQRLAAAFPQLDENFVTLVESSDADAMRASARAVEQSYRAHPELFSHVFAPRLSPMFRDYGALWLSSDELSDMAARLKRAGPMLKALAADPTLEGLANLTGGLVRAAATGRAPPMLSRFFNQLGDTVTGAVAGKPVILDWRKLGGMKEPAPPARYAIIVKPKLDYSAIDPAAAAMEQARRIADDPEITRAGKVRVWLTGEAAMNAEEFETVTGGAILAGLTSLVLVTLVMVLGLPARRLVLPALALVITGFFVNAGFATLAVGQLNMISVAFAVLFIGLGVDYAVHFVLRWAEEAGSGRVPSRPIAIAAASIGPALALSAVTTIFGFLAFTPTHFTGMAQLGVIAAGGIAIAFAGSLTLIPAILSWLPFPRRWRVAPAAILRQPPRRRAIPHLRAAITLAVIAAAIASIALLPKVRFDGDPVNLKDPASPAVIAFNRLLKDEPGLVYALSAITAGPDEARALAQRLTALPEVARVRTVEDFLPEGQRHKLAILHSLKGRIPDKVNLKRSISNTARLRALSRMTGYLKTIASAPGAEEDVRRSATRLRRAVELFLATRGGEPRAAGRLEAAIFIRLPDTIAMLGKLARAPALTIETMDPQLRAWYVAPDGRWRLEIIPQGALDTEKSMRAFAAAVRKIAPAATGAPVEITGAADVVSSAMRAATLIALAVVVVIVLLVMRSFVLTLLVLAPIVLAALLLAGYTVLFNAPFNFANVIVIPLLLGLGVDSAIHYVHRAREEVSGAVPDTSTPRAILISALTTIGSFGTLWLTPHRGMSSMGELLTVSVSLTLLTTLVVLPQLLAWLRRWKSPPAALDRQGGRGS